MGDYTAMTVRVRAPKEFIPLIADIVEQYFSDHTRDPAPEKEPDATSVQWSGGDVRCGSADELTAALQDLMREGDEDAELPPTRFAHYVWEDPKYEWLGSLYIHVPTDGESLEFSSDCDADGNAVFSTSAVMHAVDQAVDLVDARARIEELTGKRVSEAFDAYEPSPLPEQLELIPAKKEPPA